MCLHPADLLGGVNVTLSHFDLTALKPHTPPHNLLSSMASAPPDVLSSAELSGPPNRSSSFTSSTKPYNWISPYTLQATVVFAVAITFMMVVTIVGNILVIIAVLTSRSLKGPQNLFLVSLAAADILVATLIIPFSLANELQGYWAFSSIWCEIYLALDVLFCTSSIVHLCAIALDRYLSISRPVSYRTIRTPTRIKTGIIVVWLISAVISFPPLLTLDKSEGGEEVCELNNEHWYILYSTIGSFFVPCVIMILVYVRIYQIAKQHTRCSPGQKPKAMAAGNSNLVINVPVTKLSEKTTNHRDRVGAISNQQEQHTSKMSGSDSTTSSLHKPLEGFISEDRKFRNPQSCTTSALKSESSVSHEDVQIFTHAQSKDSQACPDNVKDNTSSSGSEVDIGVLRLDHSEQKRKTEQQKLPQGKEFKDQALNLSSRYKGTMITSSGTKLVVEGTPTIQGVAVSRRKALVNREKRFTFVLAVVMGVFVICWFPFFLSYSLKAVCPQTCAIPDPLFKFFFWIGYCNSCLNPVIYTIFNKDFRKAFKRILCRDTNGTVV